MDAKKLKAEKRELTGRKLKSLRASGILPGNVYGKGIKSEALQVDIKEFQSVYKDVGETGIISLEIGKEVKPVLIGNLQLNAKSDEPVHVDFRQVDLKEKIEANVPVSLIGESPAEKQSLGTVVLQLNEIQVSALPTDLPEKFEVSVEDLTEVDQAIYVKDLKVSAKVEILTEADSIVAKVEPPQKEEVIEVPAAEEGEAVSDEAETTDDGKTDAGTEPTQVSTDQK